MPVESTDPAPAIWFSELGAVAVKQKGRGLAPALLLLLQCFLSGGARCSYLTVAAALTGGAVALSGAGCIMALPLARSQS